MKLDLKRLLDIVDEKFTQTCELDLSWIKRHGKVLIPGPVAVEAHFCNRASVLTLTYDVKFKLPVVCDRCLLESVLDKTMRFSHTIVRSLNNPGQDDGYLVLPSGIIDLGELAASDIQLELPTTFLCAEDCKGLCKMCGVCLNKQSCGCDGKSMDPRFEILKKLL